MNATDYVHIEPASGVDSEQRNASWPPFWRETLSSREMACFVEALRLRGQSVRDSVLDDLATYHGCTIDEATRLAINWGRDAFAEWEAAEGDACTYHRTTTSSLYSLLWYGYLQAEGFYYPLAAGTTRAIGRHGGHHLDFGSGVGVTSQVFRAVGYEVTLADVSTTLLEFARFRLERRGIEATYIDLNTGSLPTNSYDVITSLDVLSLVPDLATTMADLHQALKPGGLLFANFVAGPAVHNAPWHLYDDDRAPRRLIQTTGFEPVQLIDKNAGILYRKVASTGPIHFARAARDWILLGPMRGWYRAVKQWVR